MYCSGGPIEGLEEEAFCAAEDRAPAVHGFGALSGLEEEGFCAAENWAPAVHADPGFGALLVRAPPRVAPLAPPLGWKRL